MKKKNLEEQIKTVKTLYEDIEEYNSFNVESAFNDTQRRINFLHRRSSFFLFFSRVAVVLIIPLMISTILLAYRFLSQDKNQQSIPYYTVFSSPGTVAQLTLPDSSKVWLNSNSSLRYPIRFTEGERVVWLDGEGYFDIQADIENPFYVSLSENVKVMAYGTKFNVSSYEDDSYIETILEDGSVDVIVHGESFLLKTNHSASIDKENYRIDISPTNIYAKTAWKDGTLIFRGTEIEEVVKMLSRRYNVDIMLHNPYDKRYKVRATFRSETITQVLDYLKIAIPMTWEGSKLEQNKDDSFSRQSINLWLN